MKNKIAGNDVALFLSGGPVPVPSCNIVITQPTIRQIAAIGEEQFLTAAQLFSKPEIFTAPLKSGNKELEMYSDFQILMTIINQDEKVKMIISNFCELVFPIYNVNINEVDVSFSLREEQMIVGMVNSFNYTELFDTIGKLFLMRKNEKDEVEYNPIDNKAASIAAKLKKGKEKIQEIKTKDKGNEDMSVFGTYASVLSVGMAMDINIFYNYTPFQLYDAFTRYWRKVSSDFYQKLASTPLMDVSKMDAPEDWGENIY